MTQAPVTPSGKRKQSSTIKLDHQETVQRLTPLAKKKNLSWRWDGSDYPKKRGSTGDVDHLSMVSEPLKIIASGAPNGLPDQVSLRGILIELDLKFHILDLEDEGARFAKANTAADTWRVMTKHAFEFKKNNRIIHHAGLNEVLDAFAVATEEAGADQNAGAGDAEVEMNADGFPLINDMPEDELAPPAEEEPPPTQADNQDLDGEPWSPQVELELEIVNVKCGCTKCRQEREIDDLKRRQREDDALELALKRSTIEDSGNQQENAAMQLAIAESLNDPDDAALQLALENSVMCVHNDDYPAAEAETFVDIVERTAVAPPKRGSQKKATLKNKKEAEESKKALKTKKKGLKRHRLRGKQTAATSKEVTDFIVKFPLRLENHKASSSSIARKKHKAYTVLRDSYNRHILSLSHSKCASHSQIFLQAKEKAEALGLVTKLKIIEYIQCLAEECNDSSLPLA